MAASGGLYDHSVCLYRSSENDVAAMIARKAAAINENQWRRGKCRDNAQNEAAGNDNHVAYEI